MTQEEYNAILTENNIAQDNLAKIDNDLARYTEAARVYANATPVQQEQLKGVMTQLIQQYGELKAQRETAANRVANAANQLEGANVLMAQQPAQQQAPGTRRAVPTTVPHDYSKDINYAPVTVASNPSARFPMQKTVSQTIAQNNTPRFINNNTGAITNPVASYPNPNLVTPSTPRPKRNLF